MNYKYQQQRDNRIGQAVQQSASSTAPRAAARPRLPGCIVVDHGAEFTSTAFRRAMASAGLKKISVQTAKSFNPSA